jgi:hypothetical protein
MVLMLLACRRADELEMVTVTGTVTYQGKPLADGDIRFIPIGDTKGPTSSAPIRNGRYQVTARGGVPVGTHRVAVFAFRAKPDNGGGGRGRAPGEMPQEQYLPQKCNDLSERKVTIESGRGKITKDFNLDNR